jgi:hypothetical protein
MKELNNFALHGNKIKFTDSHKLSVSLISKIRRHTLAQSGGDGKKNNNLLFYLFVLSQWKSKCDKRAYESERGERKSIESPNHSTVYSNIY